MFESDFEDGDPCAGCSSTNTFVRSDGDLECEDCPHITHEHDWEQDGKPDFEKRGGLFINGTVTITYRCKQRVCDAQRKDFYGLKKRVVDGREVEI